MLLGAASAAALTLSLPASAQDQSTETVVVTGSRIPQQGLYAPSPVTAVGQQEMKFEGTTGVETLLNNLPSVFADQTSGVSNGATGTATVNLRGLGAVRTLVLVNGTRLMPGDPITPVADLNQIPAALVDHVEVLTGGASAVYGSDALAGVVNFVMRKDFEGIEVDGQYSIASGRQHQQLLSRYRLERGIRAGERGHLGRRQYERHADHGHQHGERQRQRHGLSRLQQHGSRVRRQPAISRPVRSAPAADITSAPARANYNRWISLDSASASSPNYLYHETGTGAAHSGNFVPYTGAPNQKFNFGALNYLQRPDTRYQGGFFAHYEVNKELDVYSSFMFTDDNTHCADRALRPLPRHRRAQRRRRNELQQPAPLRQRTVFAVQRAPHDDALRRKSDALRHGARHHQSDDPARGFRADRSFRPRL